MTYTFSLSFFFSLTVVFFIKNLKCHHSLFHFFSLPLCLYLLQSSFFLQSLGFFLQLSFLLHTVFHPLQWLAFRQVLGGWSCHLSSEQHPALLACGSHTYGVSLVKIRFSTPEQQAALSHPTEKECTPHSGPLSMGTLGKSVVPLWRLVAWGILEIYWAYGHLYSYFTKVSF